MFKIKLKTKNGNDLGNKETFTIYTQYSVKKNSLTGKYIGFYSYKIYYKNNVTGSKEPLALHTDANFSLEEFHLKVIANMYHIVCKYCTKNNINPDSLLFISDQFTNNTKKLFNVLRGSKDLIKKQVSTVVCDTINSMQKLNPNTLFMCINPTIDTVKYKKSIIICKKLSDKLIEQLL